MPGETERGSIFRLPIYLPHSAWHGHSSFAVRWPGVLAGHKTPIQGAFQMVANRHGSGTDAASASGSATAGCRQSRSGSPAGVAAVEPLKKSQKALAFHFRLWHTDSRWLPNGDIEGEWFQPTMS